MSRMIVGLACSMLLSAGCSREETQTPSRQGGSTAAQQAERPAGTMGKALDLEFVGEQLALGEKEIGLAELAAERAERSDVQSFAQTLQRDHRESIDRLKGVAAGRTVPTGPHGDQLRVEKDRLSKLSGAEFEREFLDEIIADHQDAARDLEAVLKDENAQLREWAERTLPVVRRHLDEARRLREAGGTPR